MRLTVGSIIPYNCTPVTPDQGLVLDATPNTLAPLPDVTMAVAILLGCIQVDQKLSFAHTTSPGR